MRARADPKFKMPRKGVAIYANSRFGMFRQALSSDTDSVLIQVPRPGFERVKVTRFYSAYVCVLRRPTPGGCLAGRRRSSRSRSALRLWGIGHGLPYVYNADENAHFVPRAVGMFGHSYNPGYFVNPPAYTYLLHAVFDLRWGSREAVGNALAVDRTSVFELARIVSAVLGTAAVGLLLWAGRLLLGARRGADRGRAAGGGVPARALLAPRAQRRADARPGVPDAARAWRSSTATAACTGTRSRASAWGWPARPSTRRASSC